MRNMCSTPPIDKLQNSNVPVEIFRKKSEVGVQVSYAVVVWAKWVQIEGFIFTNNPVTTCGRSLLNAFTTCHS